MNRSQIKAMLLLGAAMIFLTLPAGVHAQGRGGRSSSGFGGGFGGSSRSSSSRSGSSGSTNPNGPLAPQTADFQYDLDTNSIILRSNAQTSAEIQKIIHNLDRPVPQALIKCLFLEVTHTNDFDFGVDWSTPIAPHSIVPAPTTAGAATTTNHGTITSNFDQAAAFADGGVLTLSYRDLNATLRALAKTGRLNVLSRPAILARSNTQATITVGQEVPRITNSRIDNLGNTINTVTYDNIGIILRVTPFITGTKTVQMDVYPEISTFTGDSVAISNNATAPVYAVRSAETSVVVPSGVTVVIGGLMEDQTTDNVEKLPVLGDIPVVGPLFRRTVKSKSKTELLIFLTPDVVERPSDMEDMTTSETQRTTMMKKDLSKQVLRKYEVER